ncbi:hypothetical protein L596_018973 [Steinernema carpocapsae]|uniref:Uncharacterized protein n=1 Tax=Steinernema carpocapsae TaxID=34508 RepID=A0A4U5N749_STECR|nr:hypothetical protein L596_018973 [Steinernema carpocapsae]
MWPFALPFRSLARREPDFLKQVKLRKELQNIGLPRGKLFGVLKSESSNCFWVTVFVGVTTEAARIAFA